MRHFLLASSLLLLSVTAQAEPLPPGRTVLVTGLGEASGSPDRARLSLTVESRNLELKIAEAKVNEVVRAYLAEAKSLGSKDEDIATANYSVNPEYDWVNNQQKFRGYRATRQIDVSVHDLAKLGDYLLGATKVGINQIQAPVMESSKAKQIERIALKNAAADAQAQAQVLAETLGLKLGLARSISSNSAAYVPPPIPMMKAMAMRSDAAAETSGNQQMGFSAGLVRSSATVSVEFELTP